MHNCEPENLNKSAQSRPNLGRGPRSGTVAHVRRKVSIGYNGAAAPQICPQKYPFPWTDPQTPLPVSSLDHSIRIRSAVFHNALDSPTYRPTDAPTDRQIVHGKVWSLGRCASKARRGLKIWPVSLTKNSGPAPGAARKILQSGRKVTKHGTV